MTARRNVLKGELIFQEEAYAVSLNVNLNQNSTVCIYCCHRCPTPFVTCLFCKHVYCSQICFNKHQLNHKYKYECEALRFARLTEKFIPAEDFDTFQMISVILARRESEKHNSSRYVHRQEPTNEEEFAELYDKHDTNENIDVLETVGSVEEYGELNVTENEDESSTIDDCLHSSYWHVKRLVTNMSLVEKEIINDFYHLYNVYVKNVEKYNTVLKSYCTTGTSIEEKIKQTLPNEISSKLFVALCCAFLCNGFGMWSGSNNKRLASLLYPQSSFFNHSCAPNIGRCHVPNSRIMSFYALRDIAAKERLCISYIDVKLPACERQSKLKATYSFECKCPRCSPFASFGVANSVCEISGVPPMCANCTCKFLIPISHGKHKCF